MKHSTLKFWASSLALGLTAVIFSTFLLTSCNSEKQTIRFGTGNLGGKYHQFAQDFAKDYNVNHQKFHIIAKNTAGTLANIHLLEEGFIDLGIVQSDILKEKFKHNPQRASFAAVSGLYTETIQIVVDANSEIRSVQDLQNHHISIGEEESGIARNAEIILESYGIPFEKIQVENMKFNDAATALKEGRIDGFFCTAGVPTPSIKELATNKAIRILSLDSIVMNRLMNLHPEFVLSTLPENTYPNQSSKVQSLGTKAVLVASLFLDTQAVAEIAQKLFKSEEQTQNIPLDFHPGAAAFYKSKNINVKASTALTKHEPIPSTGD